MAEKSSQSPQRIYRWEGLAFNGLCALYYLTLAPFVVAAADAAMRDETARVIWLAALLTAVSLAEIYAFPRKMRYVRKAAREHGDEMGAGFFLWMFHAVISVIILFLIAGALGFKVADGEGEGGADLPWWLMVLIPVVVIKELAFLFCLFVSDDPEETGGRGYRRPNREEWILDLVLIAYACVAHSATWGAITLVISMEKDNPPMFILNLAVSSLLFLIFYLPLRIPYWLEEIAQVKSTADAWKLAGSVLIVLVPAIAVLG